MERKRENKDARPGDPGRPGPSGLQGEDDRPPEVGGPKGPEPTRFGDWEQGGRCTDF